MRAMGPLPLPWGEGWSTSLYHTWAAHPRRQGSRATLLAQLRMTCRVRPRAGSRKRDQCQDDRRGFPGCHPNRQGPDIGPPKAAGRMAGESSDVHSQFRLRLGEEGHEVRSTPSAVGEPGYATRRSQAVR